MSEREKLLRKLSAVEFAAHELHVYLDTHPNDKSAGAAVRKYDEQCRKLQIEYQSKFGPLTPSEDGSRWAWIADPWPWNTEEG